MHSSGSGIPQKLIHAYAPAGHWNPPPSPVQQERACIMPGQQMKSQITTTATVQGADRLVQRAVKHQRFPAPPPPRPRPHPKMLSSAEGLARSGPEASLQHRVCNARCRSRGRHGAQAQFCARIGKTRQEGLPELGRAGKTRGVLKGR